jgi:hypothetical protein
VWGTAQFLNFKLSDLVCMVRGGGGKGSPSALQLCQIIIIPQNISEYLSPMSVQNVKHSLDQNHYSNFELGKYIMYNRVQYAWDLVLCLESTVALLRKRTDLPTKDSVEML